MQRHLIAENVFTRPQAQWSQSQSQLQGGRRSSLSRSSGRLDSRIQHRESRDHSVLHSGRHDSCGGSLQLPVSADGGYLSDSETPRKVRRVG